MTNRIVRSDRGAGIALVCALALFVAGPASAAAVGARLTAVAGKATSGDAALTRAGALAEDTPIETGDDGGAAMLVDEDSVVELCAETIMTLTRNEEGNRVVEVSAGTMRIVVEPRLGEEHIQIHTPAAIATILGTVVYVTVDPVTGESSITSADNPVRVEARDPKVTGSTTIQGSERITMKPGEAPATEPEKLPKSALTNLGSCLMDSHTTALDLDRLQHDAIVGERIALADGSVAGLPSVASGGPDFGPPGDASSIENPADVLSPIDTVDGIDPPVDPPVEPPIEPPGDIFDLPQPCQGIPGDGCFPFPSDLGSDTVTP